MTAEMAEQMQEMRQTVLRDWLAATEAQGITITPEMHAFAQAMIPSLVELVLRTRITGYREGAEEMGAFFKEMHRRFGGRELGAVVNEVPKYVARSIQDFKELYGFEPYLEPECV